MAYLTKKSGRYYIRDSYKSPVLNENKLPLKDSSGNPVYKTKIKWIKSSKIKKLAEIELARYEENKDRGRIGLDRKATSWHEIKEKYLSYSKASKAATSHALDIQLFRNLEEFYPELNSVEDLNISFCENFFVWLKENKKNSDATIKRKGTTLKNTGSKLVEWNILSANPLQKLKMPKVTYEKEVKYWDKPSDIKKIIDNTSGVWKTINLIGFCIGTRISETLNLHWNDINFDENSIRIQSSGNFRTKSRKFRYIKMPAVLMEHLTNLKKFRSEIPGPENNKIIVYSDGTRPSMASASNYLIKIYKKLGFKGYHSHCLRHTFAAQYLAKNKDIYGLSKILGHSSVEITQKHYGHLMGNYFDSSMSRFNPFE